MENIKECLNDLKIDIVEKKLLIDEIEYSSKSKNITMLEVKKDFLNQSLVKSNLKEILIYLVNKVLESKDFFVNQKVVATINLLKSIRKNLEDKNDIYSLNLVIRNLKAYHTTQKSEIHIKSEEREFILNTLVILAFSNAFNNILKNIYVK